MSEYPETRNARSGEVEMVLSVSGIDFKSTKENFRLITSPCCGRSSATNTFFSISKEKGLWRCFDTACDKRGNWVTFCDLIGRPLPPEDRYVHRPRIEFKDTWEDHFAHIKRTPLSSGKYPQLLDYCLSRGISKATLDDFRIVSKGPHVIQIPLFIWHNDTWKRVNARNIKCIRPENDTGPKNWFEVKGGPTHLLMGNHQFNPDSEDKKIYIFEGQWDMLTAYELGLRNVFSLPNGASNVACGSMLQYIPHDWDIVVCMDNDKAGYEAKLKFFSQIGGKHFRELNLPEKDLNDWLKACPELTKEMVLDTMCGFGVEKKKKQNYLNFIDAVEEEQKPITTTPWQKLNDYLQGGFYAGQVTSLLAPSGSGKTTIVNQLSMATAASNVPVGLISLEDTPIRLKKKLKLAAMGVENGIEVGVKNIFVTQLSGQQTTHEELLTACETMINEGCKLIVIDNINFISGTIIDQLNSFRRVISLVKDREVHALIVNQPNKIDPRQSINSQNQKGFSDAFQGVWNHLNLNLDPKNERKRILNVEKCRDKYPGLNANVSLEYVDSTNTYEASSLKRSTVRSISPLKVLKSPIGA